MKNQYAGDLHDYRKLGLLRILAERYSKIGVVWMKTEDDGNRRKYVDYPKYKHLDCKLFNKLKCYNNDLKQPVNKPNIKHLEVILNELNDGKFEFVDSIKDIDKLNNCDLIFFDPDNGITFNSESSKKHLRLEDITPKYKNSDWLIVHFLQQRASMEKRLENIKEISSKFNRNVQAIKGGDVVYFYITNKPKENIIEQSNKFFQRV